jgi:AcrR family transcriptional regulator
MCGALLVKDPEIPGHWSEEPLRMEAERAPDPSRRSERSRRAILSATAELVFEIGYANVTIEAIAARAGVGKQTIYRWWSSKSAVVLDAFLAQQETEPGSHALPDSGDLERDLKEILRTTAENLLNPRIEASYRALAAEIQYDPTLGAELLERLLGPLLEVTKARLRSAQTAGQIDATIDLGIAVELLYGPLFHRWLLRTAPLSRDYTDHVAELFLRASFPR